MSEKKTGVLGGFKAFLMRGNVIDLAVAVVIGAAFTNIVNSVVKGVINPVVGAFGTKDLEHYSSCLKGPCVRNAAGEVTEGVSIQWGMVLSASLTFLITAAVVYFLMLLPMKRWQERRAPAEAEAAKPVTEVELLTEIRDALVAARRDEGPGAVPAQR